MYQTSKSLELSDLDNSARVLKYNHCKTGKSDSRGDHVLVQQLLIAPCEATNSSRETRVYSRKTQISCLVTRNLSRDSGGVNVLLRAYRKHSSYFGGLISNVGMQREKKKESSVD